MQCCFSENFAVSTRSMLSSDFFVKNLHSSAQTAQKTKALTICNFFCIFISNYFQNTKIGKNRKKLFCFDFLVFSPNLKFPFSAVCFDFNFLSEFRISSISFIRHSSDLRKCFGRVEAAAWVDVMTVLTLDLSKFPLFCVFTNTIFEFGAKFLILISWFFILKILKRVLPFSIKLFEFPHWLAIFPPSQRHKFGLIQRPPRPHRFEAQIGTKQRPVAPRWCQPGQQNVRLLDRHTFGPPMGGKTKSVLEDVFELIILLLWSSGDKRSSSGPWSPRWNLTRPFDHRPPLASLKAKIVEKKITNTFIFFSFAPILSRSFCC
jgi:hypothetical protein